MLQSQPEQMSLILFSGDFDKAMAALTLANGAAGNGMQVSIFFTFWGISLLRQKNSRSGLFLEKLFKTMMPLGADKIGLSKFNFCGVGPWLLKIKLPQKRPNYTRVFIDIDFTRSPFYSLCGFSITLMHLTRETALI